MTLEDNRRNFEEIKQQLLLVINHASWNGKQQAEFVAAVHQWEDAKVEPRIICMCLAQMIIHLLS